MLRPYNRVRILHRHDAPLSSAARAALVQDDVDGQPVQPRAECALPPERAQLVPEPHEDILSALLGVARVARQAETERVDTTDMLAVQLPKSGLVAGLGPGDQIVRWGHSTKTPWGAAAFGPGPSRQPHAAEQLPQALLEILLHFIDARALLRDLGLRLGLDLVHARAHRAHLGVDQRIHAIAHLLLRRGDLLAEHRAQA